MMKNILLSLFLLPVSFSLFSQQVDILKDYNGDFENGIAFWRFFEVPDNIGSKWEITSDAVGGNNAVKLIWVASDGTVQDRGFDNWSAAVPVISGENYTVKAFMKSDTFSGLKVNMLLGFFDASGAVIFPQYSVDCLLSDTYSEYQLTATAPGDASTCWVAFRMYDLNNNRVAGTVYLDSIRIMGLPTDLVPRLMPVTLSTGDVPIAGINVTEPPYNARNDGSEDATAAFQQAINRAAVAGGAVVFVPAGTYRFDGYLNIPERVILRGEWQNPDSVGSVMGTILMPYGDKGSETGHPFISIQRGAGIKNLSVYYPEQIATAVTPYPWTIHCHPDGDAGAGDNTSVINVTLVNAYNGIKIGPNWNELHYLRNVYGMPLKHGIWLSQTTDIGRIENVHFEPKYWSNSGITGSPSEETILQWTQNNSTVGIVMGRSDWEYLYDISFVGYHTGMQIIKYSDMGPNGVVYGLRIEKSNIGVDLVNLNPIGWAFTNAVINVEGPDAVCVKAGDEFNSTVQFNTCTFGGGPVSAIRYAANSTGRMTFQNCIFENWGQGGDAAAVDCERGTFALLGNTFLLNKKHMRLGTGVPGVQVLDNKFPAGLIMDNQSTGEILVSDEPLNLKKQSIIPPHPYAPETRPPKDDLYSVIDFGAVADGHTDNTDAFQAALDSAGNNGGGTVYIPAGMYVINTHLIVPSNVELRGIYDVPHHTISRGSILLAYEGKGDENGTPFISLQPGSGVRGLTIWYPEQSDQNFLSYPWSIRAMGENCWIRDVVLSNTWQGVDLASYPSAGHVVSYLAGAPLKTGIFVDKNGGDGWIENIQFNPHYWGRSNGYPQDHVPDMSKIITFQQENLVAFKVASAIRENILGTFVFAASKGFFLAPDNGTSHINVFLHGTDAGSDGVYLESAPGSEINFINTQLVLLGSVQNGIITSSKGFGANASFFNTISWGGTGPTANIFGNGDILIQQIHTLNGTFKFYEGRVRTENVSISSNPLPQYVIGNSVDKVKLFGSFKMPGMILYNYKNDKSAVEADYNYYYKSSEKSGLVTGWENSDIQNTWDNMLFGYKDTVTDNPVSFFCMKEEVPGQAHTGSNVLKVIGTRIDTTLPMFKVFNYKIPVDQTTTLSYWLRPENESGKHGHIDILFTDGTRLTDLSAVADDGLPLNAPRGTINEWLEVKCSLGAYASGKIIQTILAGIEHDTSETYEFWLDDLLIDGAVSVNDFTYDKEMLSLRNHPNPFNNNTAFLFKLARDGYVTLKVYNMLGKEITVLADKVRMSKGSHELMWNPGELGRGVYLYRLEFISDDGKISVQNGKMISNY